MQAFVLITAGFALRVLSVSIASSISSSQRPMLAMVLAWVSGGGVMGSCAAFWRFAAARAEASAQSTFDHKAELIKAKMFDEARVQRAGFP